MIQHLIIPYMEEKSYFMFISLHNELWSIESWNLRVKNKLLYQRYRHYRFIMRHHLTRIIMSPEIETLFCVIVG